MPHDPKPTIRLIAEKTGYSKATVANALNGTTTVSKQTAELVLKVADELGYRRNPMVGTLMSAVRRSGQGSLQGTLAVVEFSEPDRPSHEGFHRELLDGCRECAWELGFALDFFLVEPGELSPERVSGIAKARGIRGIIILPSWRLPDFSRFDWEWLTGVYTDYISNYPTLNCVCCDHYRTVLIALEALYERGYRKPGVIFEIGREERIDMHMSAAIRTFHDRHPDVDGIHPIYLDKIERESVIPSVLRCKPDVVLCHEGNLVLDWMLEAGFSVPQDIGFVCLNLAKATVECAGLDLCPRDIGRCAVEQLVAQVQREAWGRKQTLTMTTTIGKFVSGPTIRGDA